MDWKRRAIYQVITDRFAMDPGKSEDTCNITFDRGVKCQYGSYCGGTYAGIISKLDYIQELGFDAVWVSPVVENTPCGYHGYWTQRLSKFNEHFGGEEGLKALAYALHTRGMALMVDSVINHVGPATKEAVAKNDFSMYEPFDKPDYYHDTYTQHGFAEHASVKSDNGQHEREVGWVGYMAELPDLKQEDPRVADLLVKWVQGLRDNIGIDGFRMDALPYTNKSFYQLLKREALAGIYTTGEVVIGGTKIDFVANYQVQRSDAVGQAAADNVEGPVIDAVINYDFNDALQTTLQIIDSSVTQAATHGDDKKYNRPMTHLAEHWKAASEQFSDFGAVTNFISVHDQPRWLYQSPDTKTYKNAFTIVFFMPGVPVNYYGDEQGIRGGHEDNTFREPMWRYGYDQKKPLYKFTKSALTARKKMLGSLKDEDIDEVKHFSATEWALTFQRGAAVVIVSKQLPNKTSKSVSVATEYPQGSMLCDELAAGSQEADWMKWLPAVCITVGANGVFEHQLNGMPMVLFPKTSSVAVIAAQMETSFAPVWYMIAAASMLLASGILLVRRHAWKRGEDFNDDIPVDFVRLA